MFATIRRYEGVDQARTMELTSKVNETLVPKLSKLQGFKGYYLIEAGNGVFSSLSLFETPEQSKESTSLVASWIRDEKLETMIPNEPRITSGMVVAHSDVSRSLRSSDRTAFRFRLASPASAGLSERCEQGDGVPVRVAEICEALPPERVPRLGLALEPGVDDTWVRRIDGMRARSGYAPGSASPARSV